MNHDRTVSPARAPKRDLWAFDRADRWGAVAVLGMVAVGAVVGLLVMPVADWVSGGPLRVPFFSEVVVPALDRGGVSYGEAEYDVILADPTARVRALHLLPGLAWLALITVGCLLLLRVLRDIGRGDPFLPANVRRLRILAATLVIGWPVAAAVQSAATMAILGDVDLGDLGARATLSLPLVPLLVGLFVALFAEAFKTGNGLRDDVDGLV